ncbi:hypothetical protein WJX77_000239 [Trebouxia sp. C0004]
MHVCQSSATGKQPAFSLRFKTVNGNLCVVLLQIEVSRRLLGRTRSSFLRLVLSVLLMSAAGGHCKRWLTEVRAGQ